MYKIDWSGKSYNYSSKDFKILLEKINNSDSFSQGINLKLFEKDLSRYLKIKNIYALSSAAAALEIISLLLNIKKGDEIIIPAHTYCASAIPFAKRGAKIVWADIDLKTKVIDFDDVKKKITKKTKAIVVVHLYGCACDIKKFMNLGKNIKIIEDCAQAFGAEIRNKKVGTLGDYSCFSFHSQKNLTTLGEGGALYVKNLLEAKKIPGLRHNGHSPFKNQNKYWKPAMGNVDEDLKNHWPYKFTLSEIQSAAGSLGLKKINKMNSLRIKRAMKFITNLSDIKELEFTSFFKSNRHVYHLIPAYCKKNKYFSRDQLIELLYKRYNIKCIVQYYPLYKYDLFKKKGLGKANCPKTELFFSNMISFPFHIHMSQNEFNYMIKSIKKAVNYFKKLIK
jgi:perosamine synthetase